MFKNRPDRVHFSMPLSDIGTMNGIIQISEDALNVCQLCNFELYNCNLKRCDAFLTFVNKDMNYGWFEIPFIAIANEFKINTISPSPVSHHLYLEAIDFKHGTGKFGGKPLKIFEQEIDSLGYNLVKHIKSIVREYDVKEETQNFILETSSKPYFSTTKGTLPLFEKRFRVEPILGKNSNYVSTIYYQTPDWAEGLYLEDDLNKYFEVNPTIDPPYFHPSIPVILIQTDSIPPVNITEALKPMGFLNFKQHPASWFNEIKGWMSSHSNHIHEQITKSFNSIQSEIYKQLEKIQKNNNSSPNNLEIHKPDEFDLFYKFEIINESDDNHLDATEYYFTLVFVEKNKICYID